MSRITLPPAENEPAILRCDSNPLSLQWLISIHQNHVTSHLAKLDHIYKQLLRVVTCQHKPFFKNRSTRRFSSIPHFCKRSSSLPFCIVSSDCHSLQVRNPNPKLRHKTLQHSYKAWVYQTRLWRNGHIYIYIYAPRMKIQTLKTHYPPLGQWDSNAAYMSQHFVYMYFFN